MAEPAAATLPDESLSNEEAQALLEKLHIPEKVAAEILKDVTFANAIRDHLMKAAERLRQGESLSWDQIANEIDAIATAHGHEGGVPMPAMDRAGQEHPLILADRSPLRWIMDVNRMETEFAQRLSRLAGGTVRNSWRVLGDHTVCVVDTAEGPTFIKEPGAGVRMRKLLNSLFVRNEVPGMSAEAEFRAMESLKTRIGENQYKCYVLNGAFMEGSPRSDLHYMFRKGYPTLAISYHGSPDGKVIAALCYHPYGYYQYTHVGVMTPTDEVIAALLTMRGDEAKFWGKSGQWHPSDPRSGL